MKYVVRILLFATSAGLALATDSVPRGIFTLWLACSSFATFVLGAMSLVSWDAFVKALFEELT